MQNSTKLPTRLYRAEQVRELDRLAIETFAIPGIRLMRRAGQALLACLRAQWPAARSLSVWCGSGNNGGDGYLVAGLAHRAGYSVQLVQVGNEARLAGDARRACEWAREQGVSFSSFTDTLLPEGEIVVDALLGTGLRGEVRGAYARAVDTLNESGLPVLAADIPSGLCSDTGKILGRALSVQATVAFIGVKQGMLTGQGPACCGKLFYHDLGVPDTLFAEVPPASERVDAESLQRWLPARRRDAHKGAFGRVLVVGGNLGMGGASLMAAQAAARVGAGLVRLATRPEHLSAVLARCPEIMAHGVNSGQDLEPLLEYADVIIIGPGLGQNAWSEQMLRVVLASERPLVMDADALNLLGSGRFNSQRRDNWLLTPHPGEAARLLGETTAAIQADRFAAVMALHEAYGGTAVLKGAGSLVYGVGVPRVALCSGGNPGMASGGMGDVLSGVLGGLLAQGFALTDAARLGVSLHAAAADDAADGGERGMLATDLLPHIRRLANPSQDSLFAVQEE